MPDQSAGHFAVEADGSAGFVRIRRTARPFKTNEELEHAFDALVAACAKVDRSRCGLLMDLRQGAVRNDPIFESALERALENRVVSHRTLPQIHQQPAAAAIDLCARRYQRVECVLELLVRFEGPGGAADPHESRAAVRFDRKVPSGLIRHSAILME